MGAGTGKLQGWTLAQAQAGRPVPLLDHCRQWDIGAQYLQRYGRPRSAHPGSQKPWHHADILVRRQEAAMPPFFRVPGR